jgi:hypothetical protein
MELIKKYGGIGEIQISSKEKVMINELDYLISNHGIKSFLGQESNPKTPIFKEIMESLFPAFTLPEIAPNKYRNTYSVLKRKNTYNDYEAIGKVEELIINAPFGKVAKNGDSRKNADLRIIKPVEDDQKCFMSIVLETCYKPDTVDDIVDILGDRETKQKLSATRLISTSGYRLQTHGIADVPRLAEVLKLYERATEIVENCKTRSGLTKKELKTLRKDRIEHENIFVREGSQERYQEALDNLTRTFRIPIH